MPAILLTGAPGCGKTTLIRRVHTQLKRPELMIHTNALVTAEHIFIGYSVRGLLPATLAWTAGSLEKQARVQRR